MIIIHRVFIPTQYRNLCVEVNQRQQLFRQGRYHRIQTSFETPLPSPSIPRSLPQSQETGSWTHKSQASILRPQGSQNRGFFLCSPTPHHPEYQIQTSRRSHLALCSLTTTGQAPCYCIIGDSPFPFPIPQHATIQYLNSSITSLYDQIQTSRRSHIRLLPSSYPS